MNFIKNFFLIVIGLLSLLILFCIFLMTIPFGIMSSVLYNIKNRNTPYFPWDDCGCSKCNQIGYIYGLVYLENDTCLKKVYGLTKKQEYAAHRMYVLHEYRQNNKRDILQKRLVYSCKKEIEKYAETLQTVLKKKIPV